MNVEEMKSKLDVAQSQVDSVVEKAKNNQIGTTQPKPDRVLSSFGISIATGLALESLFQPTHPRYDKDRKIPNHIKIEDYTILAVNVMTIAKNVINSISPKADDYFKILENSSRLEHYILEELAVIDGLLFGSDVKLLPYLPDYDYIASKLNHGKVDSLTKVLANNSMLYKVMRKMKLEFSIKILRGEKFYKLKFKGGDKVLMFSSFPHDFLNMGNIHGLENHTGVLLKPNMFNKKYKTIGTDKHFNMLPFDELLLYLIGDNTTSMLCNYGEKVRKKIYQLAIEEKWTPTTSILRIQSVLRRDPFILGNMQNFNRLY